MLKRDKEFAVIGMPNGSVRKETNAVSGTTVMSVQNQHQKPLHPLSHQQRGRSASRKGILRGRSPSGKSNRQPCKDLGICTKLLCDNWHPPESRNRVVHSAISARSRTGTLRNNQIKSRKRVVTKMHWFFSQMCDSWVVYFKTQSRWNLYRFYGRAPTSWDQFDKLRFTKATQRHADIREKKGPSLPKKTSQSSSSSQSLRYEKFEDRSQKEIERTRAMHPRRRVETRQENIYKRKETDKTTIFSPTNEWSLLAPSTIKPQER